MAPLTRRPGSSGRGRRRGPGGITAAVSLARHGIEVLLVERRAVGSELPRATVLGVRTMEILRSWGLADRVLAGGVDVEMSMLEIPTAARATEGIRIDIGYPSPTSRAPWSARCRRPACRRTIWSRSFSSTWPPCPPRASCAVRGRRRPTHLRASGSDLEKVSSGRSFEMAPSTSSRQMAPRADPYVARHPVHRSRRPHRGCHGRGPCSALGTME